MHETLIANQGQWVTGISFHTGTHTHTHARRRRRRRTRTRTHTYV